MPATRPACDNRAVAQQPCAGAVGNRWPVRRQPLPAFGPKVAAAFSLSGCTPATDIVAGSGSALFASVALLSVGIGGYMIGMLRARHAIQEALRASRTEASALRALLPGWSWKTDRNHRVLMWHGPAAGDSGAADRLFASGPLASHLQAHKPFSEAVLSLDEPVQGYAHWALQGVPNADRLGRFDGFIGTARPVDAEQKLQAQAAAGEQLMRCSPAPVLWASDNGNGWTVGQFNAAAATWCPQLEPRAPLQTVLERLSPAAVQAVQRVSDDARLTEEALTQQADGWLVPPAVSLPSGGRVLLLARVADGEDNAAGAADAVQAAESESFSFTVSHDLRAPIRVVEGFTRIVKEDYGRLLDRVGNDHLDRVLGAAARMNSMIDALLTLARLSAQPLVSQPVDLSLLATYVVDDLRRAAPERDAEVEIEPALRAQGDPTLLRLVLENLLGNAWKYSARCSRSRISLTTAVHGGRRAFVVRDNGAGFDMRSADRLFGLFQRLHSANDFPGHGVGLASVRRIVRRHGGDIWAEAEPGRGAAFFFTLPH